MKTAVAYYSLGGTTRSYARAEAKARNADLIELTPKTPYNRFTAFVLDAPCDLPPSAGKRELLAWMEGHLLQKAELMGEFQSRRAEKISR